MGKDGIEGSCCFSLQVADVERWRAHRTKTFDANKNLSFLSFSFKHQNKTLKLFLNPAKRLSRKFPELLCFCSAVGSNKRGLQGLGADKQTAAQRRSTALSQRSRSRISKYQNNTQVWVFSSRRAERLRAGLWFSESGACVFHSLQQDEQPPSGDI